LHVLIAGHMVRFIASAVLLSSITLGFACSSSESAPTPPAADGGTDGAETGGPLKPEDIPAVAIEASADADCPSAYKTKAPKAGATNSGYLSGGQSRAFYLLVPDGDPSGPQPVFLAFNGTGEDGQSFADRAQLKDFVKRGFVVIAPSSIGNGETWPVWD